ncbi:MAG TPA: DUF6603 domain-containing protein, partial [Bryobacteraceae bacterium]|nr:DUF6603 domain-containing protein [Bryobacteraceae bacterium]
LTTPSDYTLGLSGLDAYFQGGPITISGGLEESPGAVYNGELLLKASSFTLSAIGSYTEVSGHPSLYAFLALDDPLGGPPAFFVLGIAAGFGYNRDLTTPPLDSLPTFPLIAALSDPSVFANDPAQQMEPYVQPVIGSDWLAAGVRFRSFELIDSTVLLVVDFGATFEIALLGTSTIQLPPANAPDATPFPLALAEMALEILFIPSDGTLQAMATLTPNSFVLDPACRLTGGFAFYLWFGPSPYAGDFVLTLGGYNPAYQPQPYYPQVARLGFNWPDDPITISGGCYFALTPSAVMAGGALNAVYQSGDLKAWFNAYADFLLEWRPFHYDISLGISIGASYTLHVIVTTTFTLELSVSLHLWGPPFAGTATIHWWVISFTVDFGNGGSPQTSTQIQWSEFSQTMLPQPQSNGASASAGLVGTTTQTQPISQVRVQSGLIQLNADNSWTVNAFTFAFTTETAIPADTLTLGVSKGSPYQPINIPPAQNDPPFATVGIRPMGVRQTASTHTVLVQMQNEQGVYEDYNPAAWIAAPVTNGLPQAVWSTQPAPVDQNGNPVVPSGTEVVAGMAVGTQIAPAPHAVTGVITLAANGFNPEGATPVPLPLNPNAAPVIIPSPPLNPATAFTQIEETVMAASVVTYRNDILQALVDRSIPVRTQVSLAVMAAKAPDIF